MKLMPSTRRALFWTPKAFVLSSLLITPFAGAQIGVAPSGTELFFDDLRGRSYELQDQLPARGTRPGINPMYNFEGAYYRELNNTLAPNKTADGTDQRPIGAAQSRPTENSFAYSQRYGRELSHYQDAYLFRANAFTPEYWAPTYINDPFTGYRNIKLGPVAVGFGLSAYTEYNDNVNRSGIDPQSDTVVGANLGISLNYQISKLNRLTLDVGIGFSNYLDHPEINGSGQDEFSLQISPGSTLAFDFQVGPVFFTVYDRFSLRPVTDDAFANDDLDIFGAFFNDAGIGAAYAINSKTDLTINVNRSDTWAQEQNFEFASRSTNSVSGNLSWSPTNTYTLALNATASWTEYDQNFQNDGTNYSVGASFSTPLTRTTDLRIGAGYQWGDYDSGGSFNDNEDLGDYYANVTIRNQLNSRISHSLSFGHESQLNFTSNYATSDYANYGIGIIGYKGMRINASVFYESSDESSSDLERDRDRMGFDVYVSHRLTKWLTLGGGYHYANVEYGDTGTDINEGDYDENSVWLDLSFPLNAKTNVSLGYRYWTTDGDREIDTYEQNRFMLNVNHNF